MTTRLAAATQKAAGIGNGMRTATIAAVSGSKVTLTVNGGSFSSGVGVIDSYTPVVGDVVAVFRQDSSWLVLGAIGTSIGPQPRATATGTATVSVAATTFLVQAVSFGVTFLAPPVVVPNINSQAGSTNGWISRATAVTTTGFSLFLTGASSTFSGVAVDWVATARA